jgi:K+-transporting ATPase ATPase C chain
MKQHLFISIRMTLVLLVLVSGLYPLAVWAIGQIAFRNQANGSLIVRDGRIVGSSLIGQRFESDRYFHSRPSAVDYNAQSSGGSNLGPTSKKLRDRMGTAPPSSADAITTSASGLDPHISPANARVQIPRVARARGLEISRVQALVSQHTETRFLGIYGEPRVHVLHLNLALDTMAGGNDARH